MSCGNFKKGFKSTDRGSLTMILLHTFPFVGSQRVPISNALVISSFTRNKLTLKKPQKLHRVQKKNYIYSCHCAHYQHKNFFFDSVHYGPDVYFL